MSAVADDDQLEAQARGGSAGPVSEDDLSEVIDQDKLAGDYPPDVPVGSLEYGITPQEQRIPEAIADRVQRERPDFHDLPEGTLGGEATQAGRLVAPDEGVGPDDESELVADDIDGPSPRDLPVGDVGTGDSTTYDVATELAPDLSAEEAAVHEQDLP